MTDSNNKLKMHSPNITDANIAKIRDLFPGCVSEAKDEQGNLKLAVDFDQLKQELSNNLVEGPQERYHLNWPGKREALLTANAPIAKTLRPCKEESVNFDTTENLFIEGDNLEALKLLQETYLGKVKMIYIDPPYNTGNDFIYEDDFSENSEEFLTRSNQKDEVGNRLVANTESNGRFHSDWLSMMYSRLKLSRQLLSDDGVVFISIDDNEAHNAIKIGGEIFGEENFIAQLAVQLNPRGRNLDKFVAKTHESVLIFVKDALNDKSMIGLEKQGRMVDEYNKEDSMGRYRLTGLRNRNQAFNPITRPKLYYTLYVDPNTGGVSLDKSDIHTDSVLPDAPDGTKTCWTWGKDKVRKENHLLIAEKTSNEWRIYRKDYLLGKDGEVARTLVKSVWLDKEINNDYGRKEIKELFGSSIMSFPKSKELLKTFIKTSLFKNDIALDFFAGSSTTAHAIMQQNSEDGGNRKFIMVQLPEACDEKSEAFKAGYKTIAEISKERIRRAGKRILESDCHKDWNRDVGFRVLKVDESNMADTYYTPDQINQDMFSGLVDNVKPGRDNPLDLLFQVLLESDAGLTSPIKEKTIQGKTVFIVNHAPYDLVACFDKGIDEALVKELAALEPMRLVFRNIGFEHDDDMNNAEQLVRQLSPHTDVKVI